MSESERLKEASTSEKCASCFKTSETEPVRVKRDGRWIDSPTVRRCVDPECHAVREGTVTDRLEHINTVYGYKYFGDYELSPEQLDAVWEAKALAARVPGLLEALYGIVRAAEKTPRVHAPPELFVALSEAKDQLRKRAPSHD